MGIRIDVVNETTVLAADQVAEAVAAVNHQLAWDVASAWGIEARAGVAHRRSVHPGHWLLVLLDDADQAGALGYHDVRANGLPLGKVFVRTTMDAGQNWTVTLSHEAIEMVVDPEINLTVLEQAAGRLWAYEACDAPEADVLGYDVNGVRVSDFVLPSFFELWRTDTGPYDHEGHLTAPLQIAPGGYLAWYDLRTGQWVQSMARPGTSRGERRRAGPSTFRRSMAL